MTLVHTTSTPPTTHSPPSTSKTPLTKKNTDRLPFTSNIDNYLQQQQNFEIIPLGIPTVPNDMESYCKEWQAKFTAAGKV
ncbi:hypothetical protein BHE90_006442 [Fusarium euwallaceae]|uniref:Uncharacterized protein n=2 Tax=Fusarium solani species complex TaxID=232080 RepID=A0A3M2SFD8_9HYPO|nr:hypothetical protein CDV36_004095 [Fusarium kuroshium]RTE79102.1 hypothetical protein BHE90_006442 [Fusarium euwallaceae]